VKIGIAGNGFLDQPLKDALKSVRSLSAHGFGLFLSGEEDLPEIKELFDENEIEITCVGVLGNPRVRNRTENIIQVIHAAKSLGVSRVNTYFANTQTADEQSAVIQYVEMVRPCVLAAQDSGITLLMENELNVQPGNVSKSPELCVRVLEGVSSPHFKLTYDPANFYVSGAADFQQVYKNLREHIGHVHLKDVDRMNSELSQANPENRVWSGWDGEYICLALGEGIMPVEQILQWLKTDGYDGYLMLEPFENLAPYKEGIDCLRAIGV